MRHERDARASGEVTDLENCIHGFADDSDGTDDTVDDYAYDDYGNLVRDQNKKISAIIYNHLNLPVFIQFDIPGVNTIEYIYDALGQKVRKKVKMLESGIQKEIVTEYLGGFQYADGNLVFFPTAEGYVRVLDRYNAYVFNYKDHLGNIRVSYAEEPESPGELKIIEENHYYPYGLKHENYNIARWGHEEVDDELVLASASALEYKYKFNGIEWQEELGLNLYDMDFRDYDPAIARWTGIDPVTHHSMSPYMAFDGNPVYWADPSGADAYSDAMTLFNYSGSGITRFTAEENGSYTITSHTTNDQVKQALADLGFSETGEGNGGPGDSQQSKIVKRTVLDFDYVIQKFGNTVNNSDLQIWLQEHPLVLVQTGDYSFYMEFENLKGSIRYNFQIPAPESKTDYVGKGIGFALKQLMKKLTGIPGAILSTNQLNSGDSVAYESGQAIRRNQIANSF